MARRSILNCFPMDSSYIYIFMSYTVCIVYIVNPSPTLASLLLIFWPLSLPQTWVLFQRGVLLLPTYLPGLESPQALRRIKSNAVLSLLTKLGQTKWPHCMLLPATPTRFQFLYPKLGSFSDVVYYFCQLTYQDLKVPKRFVGLNQMQCSPSFDWNWSKQNDPTAC